MKPEICVDESIIVYGSSYTLTAAVQMSPGHSYSIVRVNNTYAVVDDLKSSVGYFPTFAAAVQRIGMLSSKRQGHSCKTYAAAVMQGNKGFLITKGSRRISLNPSHDGVHVLIYAKNTMTNDFSRSRLCPLAN